jgi:hypothetical protein
MTLPFGRREKMPIRTTMTADRYGPLNATGVSAG